MVIYFQNMSTECILIKLIQLTTMYNKTIKWEVPNKARKLVFQIVTTAGYFEPEDRYTKVCLKLKFGRFNSLMMQLRYVSQITLIYPIL